MGAKNGEVHYGVVAQTLHWVVFLAVVAQYVIAEFMPDIKAGNENWTLFDLHKSIGLTILFVMFFRIWWRMYSPPPKLPAGLQAWQRRAARSTHLLLYACVLLMPITGYIAAMGANFKVTWFGLFDAPDLIGWLKASHPEWFGEKNLIYTIASDVHGGLSNLLYFIVGLHVAAALWHHYIRHDDVLRRMLPFRSMASK